MIRDHPRGTRREDHRPGRAEARGGGTVKILTLTAIPIDDYLSSLRA